MNLIGALIGGVIGGLVGCAVWVGVGYATGYSIGWIAWGVGFAAGCGVSVGSRGQAGQTGGMLAAVIALGSIVLAKYAVVELVVSHAISDKLRITDTDVAPADDREFWVSYVANEIVREKEKAGKPVQWPAGMTASKASQKADYPTAIWNDAGKRWDAQSYEQRENFRNAAAAEIVQERNSLLASFQSSVTHEGFVQSFHLMDILFGFLAVGTAMRVGSSEIGSAKS